VLERRREPVDVEVGGGLEREGVLGRDREREGDRVAGLVVAAEFDQGEGPVLVGLDRAWHLVRGLFRAGEGGLVVALVHELVRPVGEVGGCSVVPEGAVGEAAAERSWFGLGSGGRRRRGRQLRRGLFGRSGLLLPTTGQRQSESDDSCYAHQRPASISSISTSSTVASGSITSGGTRITSSPVGSGLKRVSATAERVVKSSLVPVPSARTARTCRMATPRTVTVSYGRERRCRKTRGPWRVDGP